MVSHAAPTIHQTMGVTLIGVIVASFFLGFSALQTVYYFRHYGNKDSPWMHSLVLAVICCDFMHQILISHTVYVYLVSHYAEVAFLNECVWSLLLEVLFNGFTAFLVQCFLALRVWKLGKSKVLTGVILSLVLTEFGCVVAFAIIGLATIRTFEELKSLQHLSIVVNAFAAAGDIVIAFALTYLLSRSRTGFKRSDTMITKLIIFALNTGALTTLTAFGSLASILAAPNTFIYICFFFNIGRFYTNSLLATLNVRRSIRAAGDAACDVNTTGKMDFMKMSVLKNETSFGSVQVPAHRRPDISIKIDTTKELITDPSIHASSPTKSSATGRNGFVSDDIDSDRDFDVEVRHRGRGQPNVDVKTSNIGAGQAV